MTPIADPYIKRRMEWLRREPGMGVRVAAIVLCIAIPVFSVVGVIVVYDALLRALR